MKLLYNILRARFQSNVVKLSHELQEYILKEKRKPKQKESPIMGKSCYRSEWLWALSVFDHECVLVLYLFYRSNMKNVSVWFPFHHLVRFGLVCFEMHNHAGRLFHVGIIKLIIMGLQFCLVYFLAGEYSTSDHWLLITDNLDKQITTTHGFIFCSLNTLPH